MFTPLRTVRLVLKTIIVRLSSRPSIVRRLGPTRGGTGTCASGPLTDPPCPALIASWEPLRFATSREVLVHGIVVRVSL
jgi:hypothetical protein